MTNASTREFTIATPSGQRVLVGIEPSNFAVVRSVFEPPNNNSSQWLRLRDRDYNPITVAADGTWINHRQLFAIANGIAKRAKTPVSANYIRDMLFFDGCRPDVAAAFQKVFATYNSDDRWWSEMYRHTWFDLNTATLHPIITT
jgi:hypothetical protein